MKHCLKAGLCLLIGLMVAAGATAAEDSLAAGFVNPPAAARPWVRWWWPGGAVRDDEIRREISLLKQAGFGGGEILAIKAGLTEPLPASAAGVDDYATPDFFRHMATAADEAAKQGLRIDFTVGSGWPYGGGEAITPERSLGELGMAMTSLHGPVAAPVTLKLPQRTTKFGPIIDQSGSGASPPGWLERWRAPGKIVAVIAVKGSAPDLLVDGNPKAFLRLTPWSDVKTPGSLEAGTALVLTDRLTEAGTLDWAVPEGDWQVFVFRQVKADAMVMGGAGKGLQLVLDHFDRKALAAHLDRVGGAQSPELAPQFGKAVRATFIDSLELMADLFWSEDFLAQFKHRRGYDLTPYLPLIVAPGWMVAWGAHASPPYFQMGDIGDRIRADYRLTVSDLLLENFWQPVVAWSHQHGLETRMQAHDAPSDILKTFGLFDMPETEDLAKNASPGFMKLARSAADIYGRRRVSAEGFCWPARPFETTPAMIKQRADLLFASGVTQIVAHGFPYRFPEREWPAWYPFTPAAYALGHSSMLNEANPIWATMPQLTSYISRLQSVLQATGNVVPVALYLEPLAYMSSDDDTGRTQDALMAGGYDFDRINADALRHSRVEKGVLVTPGGARFPALVLANVAALRAEVAEMIRKFANQGLAVVVAGKSPEREEGFLDHVRRDRRVRGAMAELSAQGPVPEDRVAEALRKKKISPNLSFVGNGRVPFIEKRAGARTIYFLFNPDETEKSIDFVTRAQGQAQQWDAWSGEIRPLDSHTHPGGRRITLELAPGASALVVLDPAAAPPTEKAASAAATTLAAIAGPWAFHAEGRGQKGRVVNLETTLDGLSDWSRIDGLADLSGTGIYRKSVSIDPSRIVPGARVFLDLGVVHDAALVTVNGRRFPSLILPPAAVDITTALHAGENTIEIAVVNTPQNAMIGDLPQLKPMPAGLIGPVSLRYSPARVSTKTSAKTLPSKISATHF